MTTPFTLFGSTTSPFVRRVRIVAQELKRPFSLVDVMTAEGQAALRRVSPLWKVPTAVLDDGEVVWDSRVIVDALTRTGWGPLRAPALEPRLRAAEENVVNAVDETLLTLIRLFYLRRDGANLDAPWYVKERARVDSTLGWLEARVRHGRVLAPDGAGDGLGRAELAALTATGWMRFRNMVEPARYPRLFGLEQAWSDRASVRDTIPSSAPA